MNLNDWLTKRKMMIMMIILLILFEISFIDRKIHTHIKKTNEQLKYTMFFLKYERKDLIKSAFSSYFFIGV